MGNCDCLGNINGHIGCAESCALSDAHSPFIYSPLSRPMALGVSVLRFSGGQIASQGRNSGDTSRAIAAARVRRGDGGGKPIGSTNEPTVWPAVGIRCGPHPEPKAVVPQIWHHGFLAPRTGPC